MPRCNNCSREINWIASRTTGRRIPVNPSQIVPDGRKMLVFPDGQVAHVHQTYERGYIFHGATCTGIRRRPKRHAGAHEPPLMDVSGCPHGCASGWISTDKGARPCPVHRA